MAASPARARAGSPPARPKARRPLDYTTKVPVYQTVAECSSALGRAGADSVTVQYDAGEEAGLGFALETPHGKREFLLPVRIDGVAAVIADMLDNDRPAVSGSIARLRTREHAAAVAWRQVLHWLTAQLAIIDAQMASLDEVMLPWLQVNAGDGQMTLYAHYKAQEAAALEAGK
jgi:hypothetical protein